MTTSAQSLSRFRFWFWLTGIVLFFVFLYLVKSILLPFVVGIFAAYFLDPAVWRLHRMGWSRPLAAGVITFGFFFIAVAFFILLAPSIVHQLTGLIQELPATLQGLENRYGPSFQGYWDRLGFEQAPNLHDAISGMDSSTVATAGKFATGIFLSSLALLNVFSLIFITPIVAFYLLRDWGIIIAHFNHLLPRKDAPVIHARLNEVDRTLSGFIRGQTNVCLIMATYYGIALTLIGLKFGLLVGVLTGLLLFLPFVGFLIGFTFSMIIALFQFGFTAPILIILTIFAIGQLVENGVLIPRLVGSKVGLHPLWIIFGMLAGAALFGLVGILISVPVTAVLGVLARHGIERYMQSPLYAEV